MKVVWEVDDIQRRGRGEIRLLLGNAAGETFQVFHDHGMARLLLKSGDPPGRKYGFLDLADGHVHASGLTAEELAERLTDGGYWPVSLDESFRPEGTTARARADGL